MLLQRTFGRSVFWRIVPFCTVLQNWGTLSQRMTEKTTNIERRSPQRVPVRVPVKVRHEGGEHAGLTHDLSSSGRFLYSESCSPTGTARASGAAPQKFSQSFHGGLQNRWLRRVANANRAFPAGAERHAGCQAHAGLLQQPLAEGERIVQPVDTREDVESAVGRR